MYADTITDSMQVAIDETNRRRHIQIDYNKKHNITPKTIIKSKDAIMGQTKVAERSKGGKKYYVENEETTVAADPVVQYMDKKALDKAIKETQRKMETAARELNFMEAARLRDELNDLKILHDGQN